MSTVTSKRVLGYIANFGDLTLRVEDCPACGVIYAVTAEYEQRRRDDGKSWFCPNGHSISYSKSALRIQQEEAARLERELANARETIRIEAASLHQEKVKHAATKGQLTKTRKRALNGVCPCCQRSFANVRRHIASQHPEQEQS